MWNLLIKWGGWLLASFVGRVLLGAGLAIASDFAFGKFVNYFLDKALAYIVNLPMQGLLGLAGIDVAISVFISAVMVCVYIAVITSSIRIVAG